MFTLKIKTENAAFADGVDQAEEIPRILKRVAVQLQASVKEGLIFDINGNRVGTWSLKSKQKKQD